jgi:hypothetical protein
LPSAFELFIVTCTIISNGYFPFLSKKLKIQACLLSKIFVSIVAGNSLYTDLNTRVSIYNGMKNIRSKLTCQLLPKLVTSQKSKPYVNSKMTGYESASSTIVFLLIFQKHSSLGRHLHDESKTHTKKRWNLPARILNQC